MSLANGRTYLAIPGPSVVPDRVLNAMHRAAPNIYEGPIVTLTESVVSDLKRVVGTAHHAALYIGNGHAAWEAALANTHARGDKTLVLATGSFAKGWGRNAAGLGLEVEVLDFGTRATLDLDRISAYLRADKSHQIRSILLVHVDTASSVRNDIAALRACVDEAGHPALLMVDCIASLACDAFDMDAFGADVTVAACQKGLMTPPGMAFVFFNPKAALARERADCVTAYWDWKPRANPAIYPEYFCGTTLTHHLFGIRAALDMIFEEGLPAVFTRHSILARAAWAAFDTWGRAGDLSMNIADPDTRSCAVTTIRLRAPDGTRLRKWVEQNAGLTLGIGLGMAPPDDPAWHGFFRLGHMGHLNAPMLLGALGTIEAGLTALEIEHASGALDAAARVCAQPSATISEIKTKAAIA
ncbi:MAG: aminotransferase class V-fold PLP-dependent enzyme [Pseudomonadota bacterium]